MVMGMGVLLLTQTGPGLDSRVEGKGDMKVEHSVVWEKGRLEQAALGCGRHPCPPNDSLRGRVYGMLQK